MCWALTARSAVDGTRCVPLTRAVPHPPHLARSLSLMEYAYSGNVAQALLAPGKRVLQGRTAIMHHQVIVVQNHDVPRIGGVAADLHMPGSMRQDIEAASVV